MKNKRGFYLNLLIFIGSPVLIAAGALMVTLLQNNRLVALGGAVICLGLICLLMGVARVAAWYSARKENKAKEKNDINSLIAKIKSKQYNTLEVSDEEVNAIKQANPFLPESYITFLKEVGFADLDWIDVGRNSNTPTNLNDGETGFIQDILADYNDYNLDDFYFIGVDNGDTYYALSRNADDKKVYIFSNDASGIDTYESFEEFLTEILSI